MSMQRKIILSLIIIVSVVTLVFFLETTKSNKTLICKYELANYNETLYFEYNDSILIKFQRDTFANGTGDVKKKLLDKYKEKGEGITNDEYLNYTVTEEKDGIKSHTYMYLPVYSVLFNDYFDESYGISRISQLSYIRKVFEDKKYSCKVV